MDYRIIGAMLNSALYLSFVTWAGVTTGRQTAAYVAIAALGITYVAYVVQFTLPGKTLLGNSIVAISAMLGLVAGILLLF